LFLKFNLLYVDSKSFLFPMRTNKIFLGEWFLQSFNQDNILLKDSFFDISYTKNAQALFL